MEHVATLPVSTYIRPLYRACKTSNNPPPFLTLILDASQVGTQIRDSHTLYVISYQSSVYNLHKSLNASPIAFNMKKQASTSAKGMLSHCDTWSFATRYMVFGASIHGLSQLDRCLFAIAKFLAVVFIAQTRRLHAPVHPKSQHNFLSKNHNKRHSDSAKRSGHRGT